MSSNRSSKLLLAGLVLALVAAGPAAAVSVSGGSAPSEAAVGSGVDVTYTLEELYTNYDEWSLEGETGLTSVTWTVTTYDLSGSQQERYEYTGQSFAHAVSKDDDVAEVTVRVQGTVPEWSDWSYDPAQSLTVAAFDETKQGGTETNVTSSATRPYTEASQSARTAIAEAQSSIEAASGAGADVTEAENLLSNAISAYDAGNFGNAQDLAENAAASAQSAQQSSQRTSTLMLLGGAVLVLALLGGIAYWYLSNRETYDKLG
jgi:hypothetical protein